MFQIKKTHLKGVYIKETSKKKMGVLRAGLKASAGHI